VYDLSASTPPRRLTFGGQNLASVWSPDGRMIAFQSSRDGDLGILRQRADGSGSAERVTKAAPGVAHFPEDWSRDGASLVYREFSPAGNALWILPLTGERKPQQFAPPAGRSRVGGTLSPDGKWLAYGTKELGRSPFYVLVEPVPATGAKHQISTRDRLDPVWTRDGRRIYVAFADRVSAIVVTTEPAFFSALP
jgi:Tol biopolymer transport system component